MLFAEAGAVAEEALVVMERRVGGPEEETEGANARENLWPKQDEAEDEDREQDNSTGALRANEELTDAEVTAVADADVKHREDDSSAAAMQVEDFARGTI
ncbi:hypothetical protein Mapa_006522 [Marchantia paleacea]|nr:hypothetical protein Mapa_006522 [Marchantia paleacea]